MKLTGNIWGPKEPGAFKKRKTIVECTPFEAGWGIAWAFAVVGAIVSAAFWLLRQVT